MTTDFDNAPYRDPTLPIEDRVEDLLSRMNLDEKAGMLFHIPTMVGEGGQLAGPNPAFNALATEEVITGKLLNHLTLFGSGGQPRQLAEWHNRVQECARQTRLGIPVTISTDPRNHFTDNVGTAALAGSFSQWPETTGLAALRSAALVEEFADIVRQEYLAVGLRLALHPQLDLATEPRWARISGTFGEDADLASELGAAYIRGLQGAQLGVNSVSAMVKHFPGGGPQKDGEDPHFAYGKHQVYPGNNFDYHLKPFRAAIEAGVSQMMPYYGMPVGTEYEEVGFAFNKAIITQLLREELGFDGIVCTDFGLISDGVVAGQPVEAHAWGVEHLDELSRIERILDAGCDQFGGEAHPHLVIELVRTGRVSEQRIDQSIRRLLREKFILGLFEDPFVDPSHAAATVGREDFVAAGERAQRQSYTILSNGEGLLPASRGIRIYVEGVDRETAGGYGTVVDDPHDADLALVRLAAPYEQREGAFESMFHAGSLEFSAETLRDLVALADAVPTIIDVNLERPAILTELDKVAGALIVNYGSNDSAFLDVVFGAAVPMGKLPFDLPRSAVAVRESRSDTPFDTLDPLFRFGHGLSL